MGGCEVVYVPAVVGSTYPRKLAKRSQTECSIAELGRTIEKPRATPNDTAMPCAHDDFASADVSLDATVFGISRGSRMVEVTRLTSRADIMRFKVFRIYITPIS